MVKVPGSPVQGLAAGSVWVPAEVVVKVLACATAGAAGSTSSAARPGKDAPGQHRHRGGSGERGHRQRSERLGQVALMLSRSAAAMDTFDFALRCDPMASRLTHPTGQDPGRPASRRAVTPGVTCRLRKPAPITNYAVDRRSPHDLHSFHIPSPPARRRTVMWARPVRSRAIPGRNSSDTVQTCSRPAVARRSSS